jgi:hypothetical protein
MIRKLQSDIDIEAVCRDRRQIDAAIDRAERNARLKHKQLGVPLVVWRDGQVVLIPPEEIVVDSSSGDSKHDASASDSSL